jgi:hypothetical protein
MAITADRVHELRRGCDIAEKCRICLSRKERLTDGGWSAQTLGELEELSP